MLNKSRHGMTRLLARWRDFGQCGRAIAILEFSIVLPMLLVLLFGSAEILRYMNVAKRTQQAAKDIGQMLSANGDVITGETLWNIYQTVPILIPDVTADATVGGKDWFQQAIMNVTFIKVDKVNAACTRNCAVRAQVAWSYGPGKRHCGSLQSANLTSSYNKDALPASFFNNPTNLISVEMEFRYQPIVSHLFRNTMSIRRAFYIPPRVVDYIGISKVRTNTPPFGRDCRGV